MKSFILILLAFSLNAFASSNDIVLIRKGQELVGNYISLCADKSVSLAVKRVRLLSFLSNVEKGLKSDVDFIKKNRSRLEGKIILAKNYVNLQQFVKAKKVGESVRLELKKMEQKK